MGDDLMTIDGWTINPSEFIYSLFRSFYLGSIGGEKATKAERFAIEKRFLRLFGIHNRTFEEARSPCIVVENAEESLKYYFANSRCRNENCSKSKISVCSASLMTPKDSKRFRVYSRDFCDYHFCRQCLKERALDVDSFKTFNVCLVNKCREWNLFVPKDVIKLIFDAIKSIGWPKSTIHTCPQKGLYISPHSPNHPIPLTDKWREYMNSRKDRVKK